MGILKPEEYDKSYFDGAKAVSRHNAGYGSYARWYRKQGKDSLGEFWKDLANKAKNDYKLQGKKVLDIGCAKGFVVEDLREMGVNAYGLDVSSYAIGEASNQVKPYLYLGDVRTYLANFKNNEFDVVFTMKFLGCLAEEDFPNLISEMNRISRQQFHLIDEKPNPDFYTAKSLEWWLSLDWDKGSILVSEESKKALIK